MPPDGAPLEGIDDDEGECGIDGAEGVDGRAGASARAADVDASGVRGAGADGAPPPAVGAPPPIGPAWAGAEGEPSGVRGAGGACGTSARGGASGGATDDWTV